MRLNVIFMLGIYPCLYGHETLSEKVRHTSKDPHIVRPGDTWKTTSRSSSTGATQRGCAFAEAAATILLSLFGVYTTDFTLNPRTKLGRLMPGIPGRN
jgi:hypothetical protein